MQTALVTVRQRLNRRMPAVVAVGAVVAIALLLALAWWLAPVRSSLVPDCGSVRSPNLFKEGNALFTFTPCERVIDDQARRVQVSVTLAVVGGLVLIALVMTPSRSSRPVSDDWPRRSDEDILRS